MYSSSINVVSFHVSSWVSVIWANKKGSFSQFVRGPSPPRSIVQRFLEHPSSHVVSAAYDFENHAPTLAYDRMHYELIT